MNFVRSAVSARVKRGFSLVEVLVAMTILSVIVLIVAGVFQQTGLAWTLGLRRADEQSMVRAVAGALTRDLSMAVDPANFVLGAKENDASLREDALSEGGIDANSGRIGGGVDFWMLRPVDDISGESEVDRELVHVKYSGGSGSVTREEKVFRSGATTPGGGESTKFDLGDGSVSFDTIQSANYDGFASLYDEAAVKVTIRPATPASINDYEIAVGSCGPDGKWGTEDDIRSWVEGEDKK